MRAFVAAAILLILPMFLVADVAEAATIHVVRPGENLYRISLRYGVSVESIAAANGLADPTRIYAGQVLKIPTGGTSEQADRRPEKQQTGTRERGNPSTPLRAGAGTRESETQHQARRASTAYVVGRGDTLYSIARRHGTTVQVLMEANGLRSETIYPGQRLMIPSSPRTRASPTPAPSPAPVTTQPVPAPAPAQGPQAVLPPLVVGTEVAAPAPMRVRRGPRSYHTMLALVAAETPLRILSEDQGWYEVQLPDGEVGWVRGEDFRLPDHPLPTPEPPEDLRGMDIVREAMRYLGIPYRWGGESSRGVDCSGFVYIVFANRVPSLARMNSYNYFQTGIPIDRANLQPGDLVFFTTYAPGPSHVGIYAGDGKFIHASSGARRVTISSLDEPYYAARYLGARRLLKP